MLGYFDQVQAGVAVLQAVGVTRKEVFRGRKGEPLRVLAFRFARPRDLRISATAICETRRVEVPEPWPTTAANSPLIRSNQCELCPRPQVLFACCEVNRDLGGRVCRDANGLDRPWPFQPSRGRFGVRFQRDLPCFSAVSYWYIRKTIVSARIWDSTQLLSFVYQFPLFAVFDAVRLVPERWPSRVPAINSPPQCVGESRITSHNIHRALIRPFIQRSGLPTGQAGRDRLILAESIACKAQAATF